MTTGMRLIERFAAADDEANDPYEFKPARLPLELRKLKQWVCWHLEKRNEKFCRVPVDAKSGTIASPSNPLTWSAFDEAARYARDHALGVGFVFSADDPYCGIDLDLCIDEGRVVPWAQRLVNRFRSYCELSPSRKGLHIIVQVQS